MKRMIALLAFLLLIVGCSGKSVDQIRADRAAEREAESKNVIDDVLLKDASLYLMSHDSSFKTDKDKTADNIESTLHMSSKPEEFAELASLIKKDDFDKALELYLELGGEPLE